QMAQQAHQRVAGAGLAEPTGDPARPRGRPEVAAVRGQGAQPGADELAPAEEPPQGEQPEHAPGEGDHTGPHDVAPVVGVVEAVAGPGDPPGGAADLALPVVVGEQADPGVVEPAP